jgi:hypothetical protein
MSESEYNMATMTSIEQYYAMRESGQLTDQQRVIMGAIRKNELLCIADCAKLLGWEKSTVAGRFNELKELGKIIYIGKMKSTSTGITSEFWKVKDGLLFGE